MQGNNVLLSFSCSQSLSAVYDVQTAVLMPDVIFKVSSILHTKVHVISWWNMGLNDKSVRIIY